MAYCKHVVWTPDYEDGHPLFLEGAVYRGVSFSPNPDKAYRFDRTAALEQRHLLVINYSVRPVFIATFALPREMSDEAAREWLHGCGHDWQIRPVAPIHHPKDRWMVAGYLGIQMYGPTIEDAIRAARRKLEAR